MPYREHHIGPDDSSSACEDRVGMHPGQSFVDEMFVSGPTAQRGWILRDRISIPRLHQHEAGGRCSLCSRPVEPSIETVARPATAQPFKREVPRTILDR